MRLPGRIPSLRSSLAFSALLLLAWGWLMAWGLSPRGFTEPLPSGPSFEEVTPDSDPPLQEGAPEKARQQHLNRLGVTRWHADGFRGRGVKVAILDSGFRGYRQFLGKVLPARVQARSFRQDGNLESRDSQHGILCGEVLHAIAPEAELLLANWEADHPDSFLEAIRWARQQGARVVSCSLIMPSWSDGEGGGEINQALARIVGSGQAAGDLLFFASAGNTAQRHWCGLVNLDSEGYHQWRPGQVFNGLTPWGEDRVAVELYGPNVGDVELMVRDAVTGEPMPAAGFRGLSQEFPQSRCMVVRFLPRSKRKYEVAVRCPPGVALPRAASFHLVVLGGHLSISTSQGSICFPADSPAALAVGAVDREGRRLHYSSCGPNSKLPKPDFVAEVPFPSLWRNRAFAGTSAAAPQAAGIAALIWSRYPHWNAHQVRQAMRQASRDLGPVGHDHETGHGLITLPGLPEARR